jgi:ElaB/YqjD/DUF883 family membrane-anchored ribosome-binding protein
MKTRSNETHQDSPEQLIERISALMSEAEALLAGPVSDQASEKFGDIRERLEAVQARLVDFYGDARKKVISGVKATDATIRSHPYESLAIALGVGVLIGALIRRSRD